MSFLHPKSLINQLAILLFIIPILLVSDHAWGKQTKLLVLGDSLSAAYGLKQEQGWVSLLQDAWNNKPITIINAAISGETTDGALARLPRLLDQHQPSHLFVELGGNDGLQGHPVTKMQANLAKIIQMAKEKQITVLLQQMQIPTNYGKRYNQMFEQTYVDLAAEYQVQLLPFFLAEIALDKNLMQRDGIHPTAEAQVIIAQDMQKTLAPLLFRLAE